MATIYSHQRKSSMGLITLDEQRIGGMSQLAIYARILGIPIKAAASPIALRKARNFPASSLLWWTLPA